MVSDVPPEGDETALVLAARGGDTNAFGELVLYHQAALQAHAARYLHDPEAVQDLVQEAFVEGWRCLDRFDAARPLRPWLRQILHHRVGNHLRSLARHRLIPVEVLDMATFSAWSATPDCAWRRRPRPSPPSSGAAWPVGSPTARR